ncbi:MAG TPA: hypothetical protein DIT95_18770, partial [Arenibacter sp.]|nr:hypothetical protein [Arenibacter sp.]
MDFFMRINYLVLLFIISIYTVQGQINPLVTKDTLVQRNWVETTYSQMSLDERLGQLFMVMVTSDQDKASIEKTKSLIKDHHIGGVIFSTGGPV